VPGFEPLRDTFAEVVASQGDHTGAAFAATLDGRTVVDLWGGAADGDGRPSIGSRACRWTIAAPACDAAIASAAIRAGVIGRCSLIVGVWMAPVTAHVTITGRLVDAGATGRKSDTNGRRPHARPTQRASRATTVA
jgi:hypothetical protein